MHTRALRLANRLASFDGKRYWETRYAAGGNSGEGSYGRLAYFKAEVINQFVRETGSKSAIEFGCGDGHQLSLLRVATYCGLDVSPSALERCIGRFLADQTKTFLLFDAGCYRDPVRLLHADVGMSLDVIYHVVSDIEFNAYMAALCGASDRYLLLYTTDYDSPDLGHQRHRNISAWMRRLPEFALVREIVNPFAGSVDGQEQSDAKFLIYERVQR